MTRRLQVLFLVVLVIPAVLAVCGCVGQTAAPADDVVTLLARSAPEVSDGALNVDIGENRVATTGEVFWLAAQASGGTLPYTFSWTTCSIASGGAKPLICGGDSPTACVTIYNTCALRVTVTDAKGETATAQVKVTVPQ